MILSFKRIEKLSSHNILDVSVECRKLISSAPCERIRKALAKNLICLRVGSSEVWNESDNDEHEGLRGLHSVLSSIPLMYFAAGVELLDRPTIYLCK